MENFCIETDIDYKNRLYVHDVSITSQSLYPYDLQAEEALSNVIGFIKLSNKMKFLKLLICDIGHDLFNNLFWLYFCLKFQRSNFQEFCVFFKYL